MIPCMDPLSVVYFFVIIPIAVAFSVYVIVRFRRRDSQQNSSLAAAERAQVHFDYDISTAGVADPQDPANRREMPAEDGNLSG